MGIPTQSILSELENGQRKLDMAELMALARVYGEPPEWFLQIPLDRPAE